MNDISLVGLAQPSAARPTRIVQSGESKARAKDKDAQTDGFAKTLQGASDRFGRDAKPGMAVRGRKDGAAGTKNKADIAALTATAQELKTNPLSTMEDKPAAHASAAVADEQERDRLDISAILTDAADDIAPEILEALAARQIEDGQEDGLFSAQEFASALDTAVASRTETVDKGPAAGILDVGAQIKRAATNITNTDAQREEITTLPRNGAMPEMTGTAENATLPREAVGDETAGLALTGQAELAPVTQQAAVRETGDSEDIQNVPAEENMQTLRPQVAVLDETREQDTEGSGPRQQTAEYTSDRPAASESTAIENVFAGAANVAGTAGQARFDPAPVHQEAPVRPSEVFGQIVEAARLTRVGSGIEMEIQLKPEHLGKITILLTSTADGVTATIRAASESTRMMLAANSAALQDTLKANGINMQDVSITGGSVNTDLAGESRRNAQRDELERSQEEQGRRRRAAGVLRAASEEDAEGTEMPVYNVGNVINNDIDSSMNITA